MVDYLMDLIDTNSIDCGRNFAGCFNERLYKENCNECLKRAVKNHDNISKAKTVEEFTKFIDKHTHVNDNEICLNDDITILAENFLKGTENAK